MGGGRGEDLFGDWSVAETRSSTRPWTSFSRNSSKSNIDSPQSSAASVRSSSSRLRNRSSFFFGRSQSSATNAQPRTTSRLDPTVEAADLRSPTPDSSERLPRRKTEPLSILRDSILGSRRREQPGLIRAHSDADGSLVRHDSVGNPRPTSRDSFKTGDEYYRNLRKQSISPPFNFEHVTHTAKTQLPALETVDEQDLPREFWAVSSRQRARRKLKGIQAEDLPRRQQHVSETSRPGSARSRPVSPLAPSEMGDGPPHISMPVEPIASLDDTIFDAVMATQGRTNSLRRVPSQRVRHPRRRSSLQTIATRPENIEPPPPRLTTFYESDSSDPTGEMSVLEDMSASPEETPPHTQVLSSLVHPDELQSEEVQYRSKQPLPPLPSLRARPVEAGGLSRTHELQQVPMISLHAPAEQMWSAESRRFSIASSPSLGSMSKSPSQSSSTGARQSTIISDTTWEDDVDFIYEQEAESTCNFNWGSTRGTYEPMFESSQGVSPMIYHAHSPALTSASEGEGLVNSTKETIAERRVSRKVEEHTRSLPVGHRGFLAARRSSHDLSIARQTAQSMQLRSSASHGNLLSPVLSVHDGVEQEAKDAMLPGTPFFAHPSGINPEFLSDPESGRNSGSTGHRKSSSYGSHESNARPPLASTSLREGARWSMASSSSMPELLHSRSRGKLVLSKTVISAPLETLPQSPPFDTTEESTIVPREFQTQPVRNSFVLRRPETPSDRTVLQAAGRTAQVRGSREIRGSRASPPQQRSQTAPPATEGVGMTGGAPGWF